MSCPSRGAVERGYDAARAVALRAIVVKVFNRKTEAEINNDSF
jgi:hypothetical protein